LAEISFHATKTVHYDIDYNSMTFYVINPISLVKPSALQQLSTKPTQFNLAISIVSKSSFTCNHTDLPVEIEGYVLLHKDRVEMKGGCVCLYVRDDIEYRDGRSQIQVHTDERTQVCSILPSLGVTHQSTNRGRRALISVNVPPVANAPALMLLVFQVLCMVYVPGPGFFLLNSLDVLMHFCDECSGTNIVNTR